MRTADVVVSGGGVMGSAAAWTLARRGRDVVLLERFERGHERGGSHGSARIFRFAYPQPDYVRLAMESLSLWGVLSEESGVQVLTRTGGIDHGSEPVLDDLARALRASGASYELLGPHQAADRFAGMRFDGPVLYQPDAGRLHADLAVKAFQDRAAALGAELRFGERATSIEPSGDGAVVATDADGYRAPVVIVATGSWTPGLAGDLVALPSIRVTREQPAQFAPRDASAVWPSFIHHGAGAGGRVAYGLEAPGEGVKVGEHDSGPACDPDQPADPDPALTRRVCEYVARWLPGLEHEPLTVTSCLYDTTPTEDFVLDRRGPVVVGVGFSGHGFKFAPVIGRILADLAAGAPTPLDRFRLP